MQIKRFIVFSNQRCGSKWLANFINDMPYWRSEEQGCGQSFAFHDLSAVISSPFDMLISKPKDYMKYARIGTVDTTAAFIYQYIRPWILDGSMNVAVLTRNPSDIIQSINDRFLVFDSHLIAEVVKREHEILEQIIKDFPSAPHIYNLPFQLKTKTVSPINKLIEHIVGFTPDQNYLKHKMSIIRDEDVSIEEISMRVFKSPKVGAGQFIKKEIVANVRNFIDHRDAKKAIRARKLSTATTKELAKFESRI